MLLLLAGGERLAAATHPLAHSLESLAVAALKVEARLLWTDGSYVLGSRFARVLRPFHKLPHKEPSNVPSDDSNRRTLADQPSA
jgi:hypothetical protein